MKKTLLLLSAMTIGICGSKAQLNLTTSDFPAAGVSYTLYEAGWDMVLSITDSISEGVGGAADIYDISKAPYFVEDTFNVGIFAASSSTWSANHPTADMFMLDEVLTDSIGGTMGYLYSFMETTPSGVLVEGYTALIDTGSLFSNNPAGVFDTSHTTADVMDTVISTDYTYGYTGTDSSHFSAVIAGVLTLNSMTDQTVDVDGYGVMENPYGSYNVLRIKVMEITREMFILGTDTLPEDVDTSWYFEYWAKGVRYPVATIRTDNDWKNVWAVEYINANPVGIEDHANTQGVDVYPNPSSGEFTIELDTEVNASIMEVYNAIGQRILSEPISTGQNHVDIISQHRGVYYIVLRDKEENMVYSSEVMKSH